MAFSTGNVATFHWGAGSTNFSAYVQSIDINAKRDIKTLPRMGGNQTANLPGPVNVEVKLEGWYDPTIAGTFSPLAFSTALVAYGWDAMLYGTGEVYYGSAYVGSWNPSASSEDPDKFTLTLAPDQNGVTYHA